MSLLPVREYEVYSNRIEELSMVYKSVPEPAGAERFRTVSKPPNEPPTLEDRITELETVVHALAPFNQNASHPGVKAWLGKMAQRLLAIPLRKM